jgi:hypothetical protein
MQISNVNAAQQLQPAQRTQTQSTKIEGSKTEEANESSSERAAETQKSAVAKTTGVGINFDKSA